MVAKEKLVLVNLRTDHLPFLVDYWLGSDAEYLIGMGVDLQKLPKEEDLLGMLKSQIDKPDAEKTSLAFILELEGRPIGHCNVNEIEFKHQAKMHLHIWPSDQRQKGIGTKMLRMAIPQFFSRLHLQSLYCEPYAANPAPQKTLEGLGFECLKRYRTVPGSLNFEQEVLQYCMTKPLYEELKAKGYWA